MRIGKYNEKSICFEKQIIIKDDSVESIERRLTELLRFEDTRWVIFGIFSSTVRTDILTEIFQQKAKKFIKAAGKKKAVGRIWCIEVNGTMKGGGVIAADDTIKCWRDREITF